MKTSDMTLDDWLVYIERMHPQEIELGLDRMMQVLDQVGWHQFSIPVVTFAGTNGKGTTLLATESLLLAQGLRVGAYVSPHLIRYNERVRLNGESATDQQFIDAFERIEALRADIPLTYFEMGTLAALSIFQQQALDVLLLEVGLGGRLDAVNCVDASIAVITQIALDHMDWLGDTRELIAREKAGIMRRERPVIFADPESPEPLYEIAQRLDAKVYDRIQVSQLEPRYAGAEASALSQGFCFESDAAVGTWQWIGVDAPSASPLRLRSLPPVSIPMTNAATAIQILHLLKKYALANVSLAEALISHGLSTIVTTGRMTLIKNQKTPLLLDVAHNPHAVGYLAERLKQWRLGVRDPVLGDYQSGRVLALFGAYADKSVADVVEIMAPCIDGWGLVSLDCNRSLSVRQLAEIMAQQQRSYVELGKLELDGTNTQALLTKLNEWYQGIVGEGQVADELVSLIVVFGSFSVVGPVYCATQAK